MKMGQRGPAPLPTEAKRLAGNPGHRALPENEPQPPQLDSLAPPPGLSAAAKAHWHFLAPAVAKMKVLTAADVGAFRLICKLEARRDRYEKRIDRDGLVSHTGGDDYKAVKPHPLLPELRATEQTLIGLWREFGMTPSSRTRLKVEPEKPHDPAEEFMGGSGPRRVAG